MSRVQRGPRARKAAGELAAIENCQQVVRVGLRALRQFVARVNAELGLKAESVAIRLVTDSEMARLNETYRHKKGATDVLSFPTEVRRKPGNLRRQLEKVRGARLGDIAISPVVAKRNAKRYARNLTEEMKFLILHGVLHLLGYDHETDRGEMQRVELRLRRRLGIA
jgi:probable rRNA maturation factor